MTSAALERLAASYETLIRALDGADDDSIARASAALAEAVEEIRSDHPDGGPAVKASVSRLVDLGHAAQGRVNFMTDALKRRIDALAQVRGQARTATYAPSTR